MPSMPPQSMTKAKYGGGYVQYGTPALVAGKYDGVLDSGNPQTAALMAGGRRSKKGGLSYKSMFNFMGKSRKSSKSRKSKSSKSPKSPKSPKSLKSLKSLKSRR